MKKTSLVLIALGFCAGILWWALKPVEIPAAAEPRGDSVDAPRAELIAEVEPEVVIAEEAGEEEVADEANADPEEAAVDQFDALVDTWMDEEKGAAEVKDGESFLASFRKLPPARREECVQRALNLVPDRQIELLKALLMSAEVEKELRETVFNDILNRDESVKGPILREIFKDRSHPCWADAAWILDVTKE